MSDCRTGPRWSKGEDEVLKQLVDIHGSHQQWETIATNLENRTGKMCKNRWNKLMEMGYTRGPWTDEEDKIIVEAVEQGINKWSEIAKLVPGNRIGKQCRERWFNHLSPELKKSPWSDEEDCILVETQAVIGNSWSKVALNLPGRSENEVKNRWYSAVIRKKLLASQPPDEGVSAVGTPDSSHNKVSRTVGKKRGSAHVRNDDCIQPPTTPSCSSTASSFKPATSGSTQCRPVLSSDDQISLRVAEVYLRSTMSMQTAKYAPYAQWSSNTAMTTGVGSIHRAPFAGGGALRRSFSSFNSLSGFDERGVLSSSHTRQTTKDSAASSLCLDGGDDADEGSHRYAQSSSGLGLRVNTGHTARHTGHSGFKKLCASFQDSMISADGLLLNSAGLLESMSELTTPWVGLSACASACTSPMWMDCGTAPPSPPTLPDGVSSAVLYPTQLNK